MQKAVFVDRDGTLIKDIPYNSNPELIQFEKYAIEVLQLLKEKHYLLIVITNQSGVARNFFKEEDVDNMHHVMQEILSLYKIQIDAFYYCPHLINSIVKEYAIDCDCRKPKPGLILKAAKDFNIELESSWMIGDILNDVEQEPAGCHTILIDNGNETEWLLDKKRSPQHTAKDLHEAFEIIFKL